MALVIQLVFLLLATSMTSAKMSVKLVETFDEMRMASAKPVSLKEQALVNSVLSQMKNEKTTQLKARNTKSELNSYMKILFIFYFVLFRS
jgi:phage regulator Rha-like protein